jgi:hypothetical protein
LFLALFVTFSAHAQNTKVDAEKTIYDKKVDGFNRFFPNPMSAGTNLIVSYTSSVFCNVSVTFLDPLGNIIHNYDFVVNPSEKEYIITTEGLIKGVYMVKISNTNDSELIVRKFVVN